MNEKGFIKLVALVQAMMMVPSLKAYKPQTFEEIQIYERGRL